MDISTPARFLAHASLSLLAELEDSYRESSAVPDPQLLDPLRAALAELARAEPAAPAALEPITERLLCARDHFDFLSDVCHAELATSDRIGGLTTIVRDPANRIIEAPGVRVGDWSRLLELHIAFAASAVLHGVTQTHLEHCGRLLGWTRDWQIDMQPFRSRAGSRVGHPARLGRFVAVAKLPDAIPGHIVDVPAKEFDILFRDKHWGISCDAFHTLESGELWRDFLDVAHEFDAGRLERAVELYLRYVMVARAFHWPPDSFAVRLSYLARLRQLTRAAVPA